MVFPKAFKRIGPDTLSGNFPACRYAISIPIRYCYNPIRLTPSSTNVSFSVTKSIYNCTDGRSNT